MYFDYSFSIKSRKYELQKKSKKLNNIVILKKV